MKTLVYESNRHLALRDLPIPVPGSGEVLVRVSACGICGSDMHGYHGTDPRRVPPLVLGHEAVGRAETGRLAGQRVVINPMVTCGACPDCRSGRVNLCASRDLIGIKRPGAFADYVAIPERNLSALPDTLDEVRAALTEPMACAVHAVAKASATLQRPLNEAKALVIGGGAIGLLSAYVLESHGCTRIDLAETNAARRATIDALGLARVLNPLETLPDDAGHYDVVIDAVGSGRTRAFASRCIAPGGVIAHVGLQDNEPGLDTRHATLQEITFIGIYTYTDADFAGALALLEAGAVAADPAWLREYDLTDGAAAFAELDRPDTPICKIVLRS